MSCIECGAVVPLARGSRRQYWEQTLRPEYHLCVDCHSRIDAIEQRLMLEAKTYRSLPPAPRWMQREFGNAYITRGYIDSPQLDLIDVLNEWHSVPEELTP